MSVQVWHMKKICSSNNYLGQCEVEPQFVGRNGYLFPGLSLVEKLKISR